MAKQKPVRSRGIRRKGDGWQAYVSVGEKQYTRQFPIRTPLFLMQEWRADCRRQAANSSSAPAGACDHSCPQHCPGGEHGS